MFDRESTTILKQTYVENMIISHPFPQAHSWIFSSLFALYPEATASSRYTLTALWYKDSGEHSKVGVSTSWSAVDVRNRRILHIVIDGIEAALNDLALNG